MENCRFEHYHHSQPLPSLQPDQEPVSTRGPTPTAEIKFPHQVGSPTTFNLRLLAAATAISISAMPLLSLTAQQSDKQR